MSKANSNVKSVKLMNHRLDQRFIDTVISIVDTLGCFICDTVSISIQCDVSLYVVIVSIDNVV